MTQISSQLAPMAASAAITELADQGPAQSAGGPKQADGKSVAPQKAQPQKAQPQKAHQAPFAITTERAGENNATPNKIEVRVDSEPAPPVLSVGLDDSHDSVVRGKTATFIGYSNYPAYIDRAELRILVDGRASDAQPLAVVEGDTNSAFRWKAPQGAPRELYYVYRVYDRNGRFDETNPRRLNIVEKPLSDEQGTPPRPSFGRVDEANIRNIQTRKGTTIVVTGRAKPEHDYVYVSGQLVPVDEDGKFVSQQIVTPDSNQVDVQIRSGGKVTAGYALDYQIPRSDWFFVGQGDLTFMSSSSDGPAVEVSGDILSDGDHITSRAAYYLSGQFGDGWKLTSSLDTGETLLKDLFNNIDRKDPRQLLRRLDSDEYYPTYGDGSSLVEDAPTQTGFYGRLQRNDSAIVIGNFVADFGQAELAQLDRGLFGGLVTHKSLSTTSFGERKLELTAFASDPGTLPARDEMRGTGGSLYFLRRQDITIGSERLRIEIRDRETGLVLSSVDLRPQEDYDIDYFQGRITLSKPLSSVSSDGGTVRQGSAPGNIPVLVARYEYTPVVGDLDGYTVGTRASAWLGDTLRLGVSSQKETTEGADQSLLGADALLRMGAGTYLKGELARTRGPGFGQSNSVDGGLNFIDFGTPGAIGRSAHAYRAEFAVDFAEIVGQNRDRGKVSGYYEHFDAGFSSNAQLTFSDTQRWGAQLNLPVSDSTELSAKYDQLRSDTAGKTGAITAELSQKLGTTTSATLALRHDERSPGTQFNSIEDGKRTDVAVQVNLAPVGSDISYYGFGQLTLDGDATRSDNNRAGLGAKAKLGERLSFSGEVSGGDGGLGADVQLSRSLGEGSEAYIGYSLQADNNQYGLEAQNLFGQSSAGSLTVGARKRFSSALSIYGENRIGHGGRAPSLVNSFGLTFEPHEYWSFTGSFERGEIDDATTGLFKRTAATVGAGYRREGLKASAQVEARFEDGQGREQEVWLFRNNIQAALNPDWTLLGRLNVALADNDTLNVRAADYIEAVAGFAYRPIYNDRLNILARYSYFQDLGPVGQITQGGQINSPKQVSQIFSLDANYDLNEWLTIGGKYGYREGRVSLGRDSDEFVSNKTHLGVLRADLHLVKNWDGLIEGRLLTNDLADDTRTGFLVGIYRHIGDNAKIGAGYSFTDFSDDLTDQSYTSRGFFVNLLGKF